MKSLTQIVNEVVDKEFKKFNEEMEKKYLSAIVTLSISEKVYEEEFERDELLKRIFEPLYNAGFKIKEEIDESTYSISFLQRERLMELVTWLNDVKEEIDNECDQIQHITLYVAVAKDGKAAIERVEL